MNVTCSQKDLNTALDIVSKAISPNVTLPILNNILVKAVGKKLNFSATNLEIAINFSIKADVKNEGNITIPAKLITSYVGLLEDDKVDIRLDEKLTLSIKTKTSETKIKGISADEFPIIPKVEKETVFTISAAKLPEGINYTVCSAAVATTRPVLAGVYFYTDKDVLRLVATDSYRLSEKKVKMDNKPEKDAEWIVPARTLLELEKILSGRHEKQDVEVSVSKNQVMFNVDGVELTSRLIEGKFPDYTKIIPRATKTKLTVPVGKLNNAAKRVNLFAKENNNSIKITATNDGKLQISTDETRVGEERAEVEIKITGENNKAALNSQYLLDVLSRMKENVTIEMDEKLTPVLVRPDKKDDYIYIIMPLKI